MSEHTPDTSNGLTDGPEPSMEDILASIRKIIADDEESLPNLDLADELSSDIATSNDISKSVEVMDLDIVSDEAPSDEEIDLLIADMDMLEAETLETSSEEDVLELSVDNAMDGEIENLADDIETSALEPEPVDDMLTDLDALEDSTDNDLSLDIDNEGRTDSLEGDADIALVKSLMADLTGAPLHGDSEIEGDVESEISAEAEADIDTAVEDDEDVFESLEAALDDTLVEADESPQLDALEVDIDDTNTSDDVMDEILSLTLDDEMDIQDEDLEASDIDVPLSLTDAIDGGPAIALASGAAALGVAASQSDETPEADLELALEEPVESDEVDVVLSMLDTVEDAPEEAVEAEALTDTDIPVEADVEAEMQTDLNDQITEETPEMPRAAKKDAIIGEVTESATADVFSSLNKVVEEKALVAERGDRIGDLVTDALRPMLKEWLDANLKGIVERAVTKEVKRISSGK